MRILLIEDDIVIVDLIRQKLTKSNFLVEVALDGLIGLEIANSLQFDLILLDLMLPKIDGITLSRKLREQGDLTPIILLTADNAIPDKIAGLDAGADDYVVKPFDFDELLARIRALMRRGSSKVSPILRWENLSLDPSSCEVYYNEILLHLTSKEYSIIELFLRNTQRIFSQSSLLDHLWSFDEPPLENTVRAHIKSLRKKLKQAGAEEIIETVYGLGYRLRSSSDRDSNSRTSGESVSTEGGASNLVLPELQPLWERHRNQYSDRIHTLTQAAVALTDHRLEQSLQQNAVREAHTLIGSLGGFGLTDAAELCREIEGRLQAGADPILGIEIQTLIGQLQKLLAQASDTLPIHNAPSRQHPYEVLIVDVDELLARTFLAEAPTWRMHIQIVSTSVQAKSAIAQSRPDAVLLNLGSDPSVTAERMTFLAELYTQSPPIPAVAITEGESLDERVTVARLGGRSILQKPISVPQALEAIVKAIDPPGDPEAKLLIVDDDPIQLDFLRTLLIPWGFRVTCLDNPKFFWETLRQTMPDLLILDIEMPDFSGIELCQVVRNELDWCELPILFLSAHRKPETVHQVFAAGGDDYVNKPVLGPELVARVLNRLARTQNLRQLAYTDGLTGLRNRRAANLELKRLLNLAARQHQPLCFMLIDLDYFKQVNAQYGHDTGDRVLNGIGKLLLQSFRTEDVVARWGGEEFAVGLYGIPRHEGVTKLMIVLEHIRQEAFTSVQGTSFHVTFSGGVAQYPLDGTDLSTLYQAADASLSLAKKSGRNQVCPAL